MKKFSNDWLEIVVNVGYHKSSSQTPSPCRGDTSAHGFREFRMLCDILDFSTCMYKMNYEKL